VEAPRTGRPAAAGPATAQAGSAAALVVSAAARVAGDATGAAQAEALAERLRRLADEDADALAAARAAFPGAEPEPQASDPRRDFAFAKVLDRAAAAPLAIAEACADVAILARSLADRLDPAVAPDLEAAARLAAGAARAAAHLVEVNLVVGEDDERVRRARRAAEVR
jgi:formiminotetrahydrofolate cyclodeaminase